MTADEEPRALDQVAVILDEGDHLAVARCTLPAGTRLRHGRRLLTLKQTVAAKHKFALVPLRRGQAVRLYGACVGTALAAVAPGEAITAALLSDAVEAGHAGPLARAATLIPPDPMPTFLGIDRGPGGIGTRNHLLITPTVPCVAAAAGRIAAACRAAYGFEPGDEYTRYARGLLGTPDGPAPGREPVFPGVDGIRLLQHESGCGMPNHGDLEVFLRWLAHHIRNPNVGGALVIGLGCEKAEVSWLERDYLAPLRQTTGKPIITLTHQALGSEQALVRAGIERVHELLGQMSGVRRVPVPLSRLVLATKCGGSDGFSGISANPALGWVSDRVAAAGGAVLLGEVPEIYGAEQVLAARAASPTVASQILKVVHRYAELAGRAGVRLEENPSQGNIADVLLTIQLKSLGAVRKAGTGPITGVLEYAEWVPGSGVYVLDTPGYDVVSTAAYPASGATLICFTTGLGTPWGNPIAPVIKISSNTELAARMPDVIDFDAGGIIEGRETLAECGARLLAKVLAVASGERTRSEENGHDESAFWQRQVNL